MILVELLESDGMIDVRSGEGSLSGLASSVSGKRCVQRSTLRVDGGNG